MPEDYRDDALTIIQMVYNRMGFLAVNTSNTNLIKSFIWEAMNELEACFQVSRLPDGTIDIDRVGQEEYYTILQRSIIADIVCIYILMYVIGTNQQGSAGELPTNLKFLKRAKAGSAEAEWGQFSIKEGVGFFMNADSLVSMYKRSAARKALGLGCVLDICESCLLPGSDPMPMLTVLDCGCGC